MSNTIVPKTYKAIINDVEANIRVDFEEYGMDETVLQVLLTKWENKLLETKAADFRHASGRQADSPDDEVDNRGNPSQRPLPPIQPLLSGAPYGYAGSSNGSQYYSPSQYGANGQYAGGLALPAMHEELRVKAEPDDPIRPRGGAIDDMRSSPIDLKPEPNAAGLLPGDEVIDSDLDDSEGELDDDDDGGDDADVDYVFCVYDKVQRVKNKWKTVFKDGMIHINGKDYLFQKCNGEFEW